MDYSSVICFFSRLFEGKSPYDCMIAIVQFAGLIALVWYTTETYLMRKQNDRESKAAEKRHIISIRPIISINSTTDNDTSYNDIIKQTQFTIENIGNGPAIDIYVLSFAQGKSICSCLNKVISYIESKGNRKVNDSFTTYSIKDVESILVEKYGEKSLRYFLSIKPLETESEFDIRHIVVFCRDLYGNIYAIQRDLFIKNNKTCKNGDEKCTNIDTS